LLSRHLCCAQSIVNVIGMTKMTPPIKDLLPRLTPILKNRHEKVQENCIDLVGRIADRGAEYVPAREWMRICFELLEMLKAHKKGIRCACLPHACTPRVLYSSTLNRSCSANYSCGFAAAHWHMYQPRGRCAVRARQRCADTDTLPVLAGARPSTPSATSPRRSGRRTCWSRC
jgi:hypothetical protein